MLISNKNSGFTRIENSIARCLFLSRGAKDAYLAIKQYAYGEKTTCFPSQSTLASCINASRSSVNKWIKELSDKQFINIIRRVGDSCVYELVPFSTVPALVHSEIIYRILESIDEKQYLPPRKKDSLIKQYKASILCETVQKSNDPRCFEDSIIEFFESFSDTKLDIVIEQLIVEDDKSSQVEEILSYFEQKYFEVIGMGCPEIRKNPKSTDLLHTLLERQAWNVGVVKKFIDIFLNSKDIQSHALQTFCKPMIQERLKIAWEYGRPEIDIAPLNGWSNQKKNNVIPGPEPGPEPGPAPVLDPDFNRRFFGR